MFSVSAERRNAPASAREDVELTAILLEDALSRISKELETRVRERVGIRLRSQAFLFDPDRIATQSLIRVAGETTLDEPELITGEWLDARIDEAIRTAISDDAESELQGVEVDEEEVDSSYEFLLDALGIPPSLARGAATRFNVLPYAKRKAFVELAVVGKRLKECVEDGLGTKEEILDSVRGALSALGMLGSAKDGGEQA